MEIALGLIAALVGAAGALTGTWLSGRHEARLEYERWARSRADVAADARATAISELTRSLAASLQLIVWFAYGAESRGPLFDDKEIVEYDLGMRSHLTAIAQELVEVAHRDRESYRALDQVAVEISRLDADLSKRLVPFLENRDSGPPDLKDIGDEAYALLRRLPGQVVEVLYREAGEA